MIQEKNEKFGQKLENEKEEFIKEIAQFQQHFEKIKEFKNLETSQEFNIEAFQLHKDLEKAVQKVKQFNDRETLFGIAETPYPDLDEL